MHTNADGLSRSRQADAPLEPDLSAFELALEALREDDAAGNLDGDPMCLLVDNADINGTPSASSTIT